MPADGSDDVTDVESGAAERLTFFSDAVIAIAITLLALELPVPTGTTTDAFWASTRANEGHYLSFLISFVTISLVWSQHHRVFRYAERSDNRLRTLTMAWLLMIVLLPFATKLLTADGEDSLSVHAVRFGFYALIEVLLSGAFLAMVHHLYAHDLQAPGSPTHIVSDAHWRGAGLMLGFGLSIPVFFVTSYGWGLWIVVPLTVGRIHHFRSRA